MFIGDLFGFLRRRLGAFSSSKRGNVMVTFALATIPMVGFVGAAVDYSRGNSAKVAMQAAIDSAALMLSKDAQKLTKPQLEEKAGQVFAALFHRSDVTDVVVTPVFTDPGTGSFKLTIDATGKVPTSFTKLIGQDYINLNTASEVVWGVKKLEVVLALDVTWSMNSSNKINELKTAAKGLVKHLKGLSKKDSDIKIAIVPFAVHVSSSLTQVSETLINWDLWEIEPPRQSGAPSGLPLKETVGPGSECPYGNDKCTTGPANGSSDTNRIPKGKSKYKGYVCRTPSNDRYFNGCYTSTAKPEAQWKTVCTGSDCSCDDIVNCSCNGSGSGKVCKQTTYIHKWREAGTEAAPPHSTWTGCLTDRDQDYDVGNAAPSDAIKTTQFVAEQMVPGTLTSCPAPLLPLTSDWAALDTKIDSLTPAGYTNITIGLAWAYQALTPVAPLNNAAAPSQELDKVIILLTDGDNTRNRWPGTDVDARTKKACTAVKDDKVLNIKIYTIRVIDGNAKLLQECASDSTKYFDVQDATKLNDVFGQIAKNLAQLRIAK